MHLREAWNPAEGRLTECGGIFDLGDRSSWSRLERVHCFCLRSLGVKYSQQPNDRAEQKDGK
jgi:hypothetical protein